MIPDGGGADGILEELRVGDGIECGCELVGEERFGRLGDLIGHFAPHLVDPDHIHVGWHLHGDASTL